MHTGYGFASEEQMERYIIGQNLSSLDVLLGVTFTNISSEPGVPLPSEIYYKIRPRAEQYNSGSDGGSIRFMSASDWYTSMMYPFSTRVGPRSRSSSDGGKPGSSTDVLYGR